MGARLKSNMRVLITGPALSDPGGVASYYRSVLPFLSRSVAAEYLEIGSTRAAGWPLHPIVDQMRVARALSKSQPDIVHINPSLDARSFFRDGLMVRQAVHRRRRVIVFFRGWDQTFAHQVDRRWMTFFRHSYAKCDGFVVLASEFRERLEAWGVKRPIVIETTAVDDALVKGVEPRPHDSATLRVLFLARLVPGKGLLETLDATVLARRAGVPVMLTVAGDGSERKSAESFARRQDPSGAFITFVGDVREAEKRALFGAHDVFCMPSYSEGLPNSVLEAMAFGMPVVTCPVGGLRDMFANGAMGYLVPPRAPRLIAEHFADLFREPDRRARMATTNRAYAMRHALASVVAERLLAIYRSID